MTVEMLPPQQEGEKAGRPEASGAAAAAPADAGRSPLDELRVAPLLVVLAVAATALLLDLVSDFTRDPLATGYLSLLLFAAAGLAWLLLERRPRLARWFVPIALVALIALAGVWLAIPGALALLGIPVILALAMLGPGPALVLAIGETLLLALLASFAGSAIEAPLLGTWAAFAAGYALHHPIYRLHDELHGYLRHAQVALDEARQRKAELEQALVDLAHANRQLALINDRVDGLRVVAEEAQKSKAAFVAKVSHEFRTPLNMIIGLVDLLVETPEVYGPSLPPALMEDLAIIHRSSQHLSSMVNDVLDLSQAEAGRLVLNRERVDLGELIGAAIPVVRPLLQKKSLSCEVAVSPDLPPVYCDRTRIRQVVLNLVSNAARYTMRGGVTVSAGCREGQAVVSVADTGAGIAPDELARIFEPFCQGSSGLRERGGSGLGLSVSKQFIEHHGGQIWAESRLGSGATFYFRLPVDPPLPTPSRPVRWMSEPWTWVERTSRTSAPAPDYRPRIIVCDPAGGLPETLGRLTSEVEFVGTPDLAQTEEALKECPAHAVLLNILQPEELCRAGLHAGDRLAGTPVIACSLPRPVSDALRAGAGGHLVKPILRRDLEAALKGLPHPVGRVLIIDDDPEVRRLLARMLAAFDPQLEIAQAGDGEDGLAQLAAAPTGLVLLDLIMPRLDGWQFLARKAGEPALAGVPVILISAHDSGPGGAGLAPPVVDAFVATAAGGFTLPQLLTGVLALARAAPAPFPTPG